MILTLPEWYKDANIYEVNIRQYTAEGTIKSFIEHLPRLKEMGVKVLWIMPIFPISETKRKGSLGSYYAISEYREINPHFGTKEDVKSMISKIHELDMKIILDWVPNHTGWDHTWIKEHPEFYHKNSKGEITDPMDSNGNSCGWEDVAHLDYSVQEMRKAMIADLVYWLEEFKIDGFRMDIAFGVPSDFWTECTKALKIINPDIFMLAEAEEAIFFNEGGFHASYSWTLHHILNDIAKGHKDAYAIDEWRSKHLPHFKNGILMHFTSNHDENSWNGSEWERMGECHQVLACLCATFDGIPLTYSGQEEPLTKRLAFFEKDNIEFKNYHYSDFYRRLNTVKKDNKALWNAQFGGSFRKLAEHNHVFAFTREKDENKVIVILNFSNHLQQIWPNEAIQNMTDIFSNNVVNVEVGQDFWIAPYGMWILENR